MTKMGQSDQTVMRSKVSPEFQNYELGGLKWLEAVQSGFGRFKMVRVSLNCIQNILEIINRHVNFATVRFFTLRVESSSDFCDFHRIDVKNRRRTNVNWLEPDTNLEILKDFFLRETFCLQPGHFEFYSHSNLNDKDHKSIYKVSFDFDVN